MPKKQRKKGHWLISALIVVVFVLLIAVLAKSAYLKLCSLLEEDVDVDSEPSSSSAQLPSAWIHVPDGEGSTYLIKKSEVLEENPLKEDAFYGSGDFVYYSGDAYTARQGVDVSFYQGNIDWQQVRAAGISFAMIRAGYRGYQNGSLQVDEKLYQNLTGALAAGLDVGVYFYSQATTPQEAVEEAEFVLQLVEGYDITFPIAYDWEHISNDTARTDDVGSDVLTDCCLAFCKTIRNAGYDPLVYFYRSLGYQEYDVDRMQEIPFWFSGTGTYPDYYYEIAMWQYSYTATVPGIPTNTDLNLYFIKQEQ